MAWTYASNFPYGITGRTLTAVWVNSSLVALGSQPAYTITEHPGGSGIYYLRSTAMPDGFDGSIQYFDAGVLVAAEALLPRFAENLDAKISSIAGSFTVASLVVPSAEIAAVLVGQDMTLHRGDNLTIPISGLAALTGATKVWFTLKRHLADLDAQALVQIDLTGLLRLNGAAATLGNGSLTIDTATAPAQVTVRLTAAASAALVPAGGLYWDLQMLAAGAVTTLTEGRARVAADVTEAVS